MNSDEQMLEDANRFVKLNREQILSDFRLAYASAVSPCSEEFDILDLKLIEDTTVAPCGCVSKKFYFKYQPLDCWDEN